MAHVPWHVSLQRLARDKRGGMGRRVERTGASQETDGGPLGYPKIPTFFCSKAIYGCMLEGSMQRPLVDVC